jgi:phage baseplate assembly protein W
MKKQLNIQNYGYGLAPIGYFPFGLYSPQENEAANISVPGARYLDPVEKDFTASVDGNLDTMPSVRQRVLLALSTGLGTSSVLPDFGNAIPTIKKIDQRFEILLKDSVKTALYQLTDIEKVIIIEDIIIDQNIQGRVSYTVVYNDLTTNKLDGIRVQ